MIANRSIGNGIMPFLFNIFVFYVEFFRKMTSSPFFINGATQICFFRIGKQH